MGAVTLVHKQNLVGCWLLAFANCTFYNRGYHIRAKDITNKPDPYSQSCLVVDLNLLPWPSGYDDNAIQKDQRTMPGGKPSNDSKSDEEGKCKKHACDFQYCLAKHNHNIERCQYHYEQFEKCTASVREKKEQQPTQPSERKR